MKIRTVYFKTSDMDKTLRFWQGFMKAKPHKQSQWWSEFKCENINLGFLGMEDFERDHCNFVPVFEFKDQELESQKQTALELGAQIVVDIKDHPDKMSYVLSDPFGNEFEITRMHG